MGYSVKEIFFSLQGEGRQQGRPSVFCRFAGCNLWSGREADRHQVICSFCDTDFVGTNGAGGGRFHNAEHLAESIAHFWPANDVDGQPYVVFTGGEPTLQLDAELCRAIKARGFSTAIETNGTRPVPEGVDWITVSPKSMTELVQRTGSEMKLLFPFSIQPEEVSTWSFQHFYLSPITSPDETITRANLQQAIAYCLAHPRWSLTFQNHKVWDIS